MFKLISFLIASVVCVTANAGVLMTTGTTSGGSLMITDDVSPGVGLPFHSCVLIDKNGNKDSLQCDWRQYPKQVKASSIVAGASRMDNGKMRYQRLSIGFTQIQAQNPDFMFGENQVYMIGTHDASGNIFILWILDAEMSKTQYWENHYNQ